MSDTLTAVERPDQEEYQLLVQELSAAKSRRAESKVLLAMSTVVATEGGQSALALRLKGSGKPTPQKVWLERDIDTWDVAIAVLENLLDDWSQREQAWFDTRPPTADLPGTPEEHS